MIDRAAQGSVKVTVIATGFARETARIVASPSQAVQQTPRLDAQTITATGAEPAAADAAFNLTRPCDAMPSESSRRPATA